MKKIKLFVFALLAMFVAVVGVNAAENVVEVNNESSLANCLVSGSQATTCKFTNGITASGTITVQKPIVIDFNGNTLTFTGSDTFARLEVNVSGGGDVTLKNGTIKNEIVSGISTLRIVGSNNTNIILEKMNISSSDGGFPILINDDANIKLVIDKDSTVSAINKSTITNFGVATIEVYGKVTSNSTSSAINGSYQYTSTETNITVYDGAEISCTNGGGILQMSNGDIKVLGGTIKGTSGIAMTKGNLIVKGGNITGTGEYSDFVGTGDYQIHENGAAVYVEPVGVKVDVEITGGDLVSDKSYAFSAPKGNNANKDLVISISGGNFDGAEDKGAIELEETVSRNPFITGGQFSGMDHTHNDYLVSGYEYLDNGLVVTDADYADLYATISVAKGYDLSKYTDESVKALLEAIEDAENVEQGLKSNEQYKINNLRNAIIAAIVNLVEKGDEPVRPGSNNPSNTDEKAPDTFDAGLVYMGLALSAIGTSIVSVKKLKNN